ncbi:hypothetical protein V500_06643 [Pseudogymnoascus sp. VKM F-4518 (FW-2643)]|nr:hypothetical protein V500_06643 [Pseudogymnoascus sp. VKM F-4518 (FW-2643)]
MSSDSPNDDSPLSITASVTGILTFVVAISATIWLRISAIRSADVEYSRVKTALNWYKTESEWIHDLVATQRDAQDRSRGSFDSYFLDKDIAWREKGRGRQRETEMYVFVLDQLGTLEERLLEMVTAVEVKAEGKGVGGGWGPRGGGRGRGLGCIGCRVLFAQLAMVSSRLADGEERAKRQDERIRELLDTVRSFDERLP